MKLPEKIFYIIRRRRHSIRMRTYFAITLLIALSSLALWMTSADIEKRYNALLSVTIYDRNGVPLSIKENDKGHYVSALHTLPDDFAELLIQKEDRYFHYHFGINPLSTARALYSYVTG